MVESGRNLAKVSRFHKFRSMVADGFSKYSVVYIPFAN
jgi:hypothetical protein